MASIDTFRLCLILIEFKFDESYQLNSKRTPFGDRRTRNNNLFIESTETEIPAWTRSCQMHKSDDETEEIFITAAFPNTALQKEIKDSVTVLSCSNKRCLLEGVLYVPNLEDNFPIMGNETVLISYIR